MQDNHPHAWHQVQAWRDLERSCLVIPFFRTCHLHHRIHGDLLAPSRHVFHPQPYQRLDLSFCAVSGTPPLHFRQILARLSSINGITLSPSPSYNSHSLPVTACSSCRHSFNSQNCVHQPVPFCEAPCPWACSKLAVTCSLALQFPKYPSAPFILSRYVGLLAPHFYVMNMPSGSISTVHRCRLRHAFRRQVLPKDVLLSSPLDHRCHVGMYV